MKMINPNTMEQKVMSSLMMTSKALQAAGYMGPSNSARTHWIESYIGLRSQVRCQHIQFPDSKTDYHNCTGIAFSGAVGIGLFITCSDIITLCGPVGAVLSFSLAALVTISVMRSLAEMVSVRPMKGALMDYPATFVDKALGVAVGIVYW